ALLSLASTFPLPDGERSSALTENDWLVAAEVDDRRRHAGQLACVDYRATRGADLLRNLLDAAGVRAAGEVRARRRHDADLAHNLGCLRRQVGDAHAGG